MKDDVNTTVVYQAYGRYDLYTQVIFSILSLCHQLDGDFTGIHCIVYTDNAKPFKKLSQSIPLTIELLTPQQIAEFKGPASFVHRLKICILIDCFSKYRKNILYADGDTYFIRDPRSLLKRIDFSTSIMHVEEYDMYDAGEFEEMSWLTLRKVIRENSFSLKGSKFNIPFSAKMWNAGVLGIDVAHTELLRDVLSLCDQLYSKQPFFSAEQFAFSFLLGKSTKLIPADEYIVHYWKNYGKTIFNHYFKIVLHENSTLSTLELASKANELFQRHSVLRPPQPSRLKIIKERLKLIAIVALRGRI